MADPIDEAHLRARLGPRHPVAAAATVAGGVTTIAVAGTTPDATFELASISKGLTGLLYVDALGRGEVSGDTRLGELLDLGDAPAGAVTLGSLATHTSGLPRLPAAARPWRRTLALLRHGTNPYGDTLDELLDQTRRQSVGRPRSTYSNLGFQLLGHAVASAAGTSYATLVADRLAAPLGLRETYVATTPAAIRPGARDGRTRRGRPAEPWTGEAFGPAGGVRSSIADVARLAGALLDGSAPGVAALDPVAPMGRGGRIGAAWITLELGGHDVCFHNGRSGGFASWLGIDRTDGTAAVILSATAASVDRHGFALLSTLP